MTTKWKQEECPTCEHWEGKMVEYAVIAMLTC